MDNNYEKASKQNSYSKFNYAGFWKRLIMGLVDLTILIPVFFFIYPFIARTAFLEKSIIPVILILLYMYWAFFTIKYGGTPGVLILKGRIIDKDGKNISLRRFILRELPNMIFIVITIWQLNLTVHSANQIPDNMNEIGKLTLKYSPFSQLIVFINEIFGYLNFLFIS